MNAGSRASVETHLFARDFIARAWRESAQLTATERFGLVQLTYLTCCGHIEAVLSAMITERLRFSEMFIVAAHVEQRSDASPKLSVEGLHPHAKPALNLVASQLAELESAALAKLIEVYDRVADATFRSTIGKELADDISALGAVRNILAHGRSFYVIFGDEPSLRKQFTLEKGPLRLVCGRLQRAGILRDLELNAAGYDALIDAVYSDEAVRYFFNNVRAASEKLLDACASLSAARRRRFLLAPLPDGGDA